MFGYYSFATPSLGISPTILIVAEPMAKFSLFAKARHYARNSAELNYSIVGNKRLYSINNSSKDYTSTTKPRDYTLKGYL